MTKTSISRPHAARPAAGKLFDAADLPIFSGVNRELTALVTREMGRTYQQGEVLCREGEPADHLYVVRRGTVCVTAGGENLATRSVGDVIGEQAFIERAARGATVTAVGQVDVVCIPHAVMETLLTNRTFVRNLLSAVSRKLSEATRDRAERYRRERLLFSEFRAHLSDEVAQRLLNSGLDYGKPRSAAAVILFSDIRNFTPTSALLEPEDVAAQLSPYFDEIVDIIHAHGGMVDKFIGDAVMAVWGFVPAALEDMASSAYQCAQAMVAAAAARTFAGAPFVIGVGINAGDVFMGNVGGPNKRQFTVLGNAVNMAARFESTSKSLGAPVAIGASVAQLLSPDDRAALHAHFDVPVKGASPQTIYTWSPVAAKGDL